MKKKIIAILSVILIIIGVGALMFGKEVYHEMNQNSYENVRIKYEKQIVKYSKKYGVNPCLVAAIISQESDFRSGKYKKGEKTGLMQIRDTAAKKWAKEMGMKDFKGEMLKDIDTNIELGTWYLGKLNKENDNDEDKVIQGWYDRHVTYCGLPSRDGVEGYTKIIKVIEKEMEKKYSDKLK
ncbi:transglycosylase SLT domain-containing protein [Tepidibacter hydrothermalis]|uniref:Transglycosylase SLT domain-containing protein n=1 Tax=Tepidibacter hydrothermalis TaxID=3036126 RepID=A0ABY8EJF4_9FIRM|nr:transglycosylase SLT domain-containing protein [Tepidibacter hydrothermalis]WFD11083.1 transglycosylase SLT domain-containing protein [Tepidibacter hydrothermalis]